MPLSTTLPIWIGGLIRGLADYLKNRGKSKAERSDADDELGKGNLFATGLVAGGALAGVVIALLSVNEPVTKFLEKWSAEKGLSGMLSGIVQSFGVGESHAGEVGYQLFGVFCFAFMGAVLFTFARRK